MAIHHSSSLITILSETYDELALYEHNIDKSPNESTGFKKSRLKIKGTKEVRCCCINYIDITLFLLKEDAFVDEISHQSRFNIAKELAYIL